MKDNDLAKLTPWVVPGWTAIIAFLLFVSLDIIFSPSDSPSRLYKDISEFMQSISAIDAVLLSVLVAGSGIPIGFLIYQFYFFLRWNSPFSGDGLWFLIPGRKRDLAMTTRGLNSKIALHSSWRRKIIEHPLYENDHGYKWRYVESLFLQACAELDSKHPELSIYSRHRYLHEVVHTLGASIGAVYLGFACYAAFKVLKEGLPLILYLVGTISVWVVFFILLHIEDEARYSLFMEGPGAESPLGAHNLPAHHLPRKEIGFLYPSSQFLVSLGTIIFFADPMFNPAPGTQWDMIIKILFMVLFLAAWSVSQHYLQDKYKIGNIIWAVASIVAGIVVHGHTTTLFHWIDWAFFASLLAFLALNLILFTNRRNANEDMLALENYTLHRYLHKETSYLS